MNVCLIDYTGAGSPNAADHAANVLIFTKSTRLKMSPGLFNEIKDWPLEDKVRELEYMANTIPSSWEFIHYTFMIEGVTRGFTHQFVRTRTASFAQQTMRVLKMEDWEYGVGPSIKENLVLKDAYDYEMKQIAAKYQLLIDGGAKIEDARGILPTNILTNIVMSCNLRTFVELVQKRSSPRVQGEYREVLEAMKKAVLEVHPWTSIFLERTFEKAAKDLDDSIGCVELAKLSGETEEQARKRHELIRTDLRKLVDQLRQKQ